jgi:hypothetical protein
MKDHLRVTNQGPEIVNSQGGSVTGKKAAALLSLLKDGFAENNAHVQKLSTPETSESKL